MSNKTEKERKNPIIITIKNIVKKIGKKKKKDEKDDNTIYPLR